jgi:hypothetical protein
MLSVAFANAVTNQTFLQGITKLVNAMSDPKRFGPRFLRASRARSCRPPWPDREHDGPGRARGDSMLDAVKSRIPGMREELLPKRDIFGEPEANKDRVGGVLPITVKTESDDKVRTEAARLGISVADTPKKAHVGRGTGKLGEVPLSPEQRDTFADVGGHLAHEILAPIVNSPQWDALPPLVQKKRVREGVPRRAQAGSPRGVPPECARRCCQEITEKIAAQLVPVHREPEGWADRVDRRAADPRGAPGMNLLKAALYDPAVAVSKATSALLAMTAFDTTNLRLAVTVPAHGMVRFRLRCNLTGATTSPTILLGVLNGATVVGRVIPTYENATANAATQSFVMDAEFTATGLAAGATNFDAAYAVQVLVAATNIKYGGPNTNAGANAWGASVASVTGAVVLPSIPANWLTAAGIAAGALNGKGDWLLSSGYTAPDNATIGTLATRLTATRAGNLDNLDALVSSRLAAASYSAAPSAAAVRAEIDANSTGLAAIFARTDVATSSRLASASYTAPDNASVVAIKAKTDGLGFTVPGVVDAHILYVDGKGITGTGTEADPWRAP